MEICISLIVAIFDHMRTVSISLRGISMVFVLLKMLLDVISMRLEKNEIFSMSFRDLKTPINMNIPTIQNGMENAAKIMLDVAAKTVHTDTKLSQNMANIAIKICGPLVPLGGRVISS
ncbi:MAG: hypothetical protein RIS47_278 [Bacteroidota bacterium]